MPDTMCGRCGRSAQYLLEYRRFIGVVPYARMNDRNGTMEIGVSPAYGLIIDVCYSCYKFLVQDEIHTMKGVSKHDTVPGTV
jgi:hypothetical protein